MLEQPLRAVAPRSSDGWWLNLLGHGNRQVHPSGRAGPGWKAAVLFSAVGVSLALSGCADRPDSTVAARASPALTPGYTRPSCANTRFVLSQAGPEVQGIAPGQNQLWGLVFSGPPDPPPLPVGVSVKIVWRMTGTGALSLSAYGPSGRRILPDFGPDGPRGSTWNTHPGEEWGSSFTFPSSGCWEVVAVRGGVVARVGLAVA